MKKLLLGALLLLSVSVFSQVPSYLTDNNIQFTIEPTTKKWYKSVDTNKTISYVYALELRNENYILFMNECNKVLTYYGVDTPTLDDNKDKTILYRYYNESTNYPSFHLDNIHSYQNFSINHINMLIYAYLVKDKKKLEIYKGISDDINVSISDSYFMIRITKRKK